jgi:hypothetical protein
VRVSYILKNFANFLMRDPCKAISQFVPTVSYKTGARMQKKSYGH